MMLKLKKLAKENFRAPSGFSATDAAREKPSREERLEADNDNEVSEKGDYECTDFKRFRAVPGHDEFKWDLPENLAKYTHDHFNEFIPFTGKHFS